MYIKKKLDMRLKTTVFSSAALIVHFNKNTFKYRPKKMQQRKIDSDNFNLHFIDIPS